jgi:hypothetical protein
MNKAVEIEALPEGACLTAKIPAASKVGLGAIIVNPYKIAPLTAIIRDGGLAISNARVRVLAKGEKGLDIHYEVKNTSLWTYGGIPVFGLYPDYQNQVEIAYDLNGKRHQELVQIYAPAVRLPVVANQSAVLPEVKPIKVAPLLKNRLYLFNHLLTDSPESSEFKWNALGGAAEWDSIGYNWIADTNGDVRWYLDIEKLHDSGRKDLLGASMGFHQTSDGKLIWGQGQTYAKYDLLGREIWHRELPKKFADFSHEIRETSKGSYLLRVGTSDYQREDGKHVRTIRDHIIELNEAGDVIDYWDLNKILDPYRADLLFTLGKAATLLPEGAVKQDHVADNEKLEGEDLPFGDIPGVGAGRNWAHVNAIDYVEEDDAIIVSSRHQGVFKIGRDKQLKWILAAPQGWTERFQSKLLKPIGLDGKVLSEIGGVYEQDFDWSWTQHTAWLTGKGSLTVFDNGWGRHFLPTKLTGNYSRAVEYIIDEERLTVQQVWEYGKERGDAWYSPVTSVVQYRPETDTQFIYSASVNFLTKEKLTTPVLSEVKYGTQDVLLELQLSSKQPGNVGYRATIIDLAKAF